MAEVKLEMEYANRQQLIVVGYPRSGNSWLARLLGDVLDSPVTGWIGVRPLCEEGLGRTGGHIIRQLHLKPAKLSPGRRTIIDAYTLNQNNVGNFKLIHIVRDPRDITVSAKFFYDMGSITDTIHMIGSGTDHVEVVGSWQDFVGTWLESGVKHVRVSYEDLSISTKDELRTISERLGIKMDDSRFADAIYRQSFEAKRAQIRIDGDDRPYGKKRQLEHMRKGIVGDWRNYYNTEHARLAERYFGDMMKKAGYSWDG